MSAVSLSCWDDEDTVLTAAAAVLAVVLWGYQKVFLQQAALAVTLAVTAGSAAAHLPQDGEATIGLAVWGLGLAWLALVWGTLMKPQRTGYLLGGAAVIVGGQLSMQADWGMALAGASVAALVTAAVLIRDLWLLSVGAVGVLITVPAIIDRYFPGDLAAPLALLGAGALLIGLGVLVARRRTQPEASTAVIPPRLAAALSTAIVVVVTPIVWMVGQRS